MPQDLLDVQAADDVVEVAAVDRVACVRRACGRSLGARQARRRPGYREQHARHHDLRRRSVAELEQVAQNLPGLAAQQAAFLAFLDDELELLGGVIALALDLAPLDAGQAQQTVADGVEPDDERQDCALQDRR